MEGKSDDSSSGNARVTPRHSRPHLITRLSYPYNNNTTTTMNTTTATTTMNTTAGNYSNYNNNSNNYYNNSNNYSNNYYNYSNNNNCKSIRENNGRRRFCPRIHQDNAFPCNVKGHFLSTSYHALLLCIMPNTHHHLSSLCVFNFPLL